MKTPQCQTRVSQSGSASYMSSLSTSAMNPLSSASLILLVLLISAIPICKSSPIQQQRATIDQYQLLKQLEDVCSSYLSADLPFRKGRDNPSKRSPVMHPLLQLVPQLHTRRERGEEFVVRDHLQGPGGIQSRGYFLYRPRNGRRSLEFE
ncbi:neuromedin-U isoform X4 [Salvelinus fontinalis]|uniref:neuromedin-U isoform X3 n=1 Tax=Salvelinus sp. IW2-2015 TaxID=2691554 RepID=UPI000CDF9532|nr:neuromedin-U isoform X3 [Salvelinus alpinus]XP_055778998.1 neuromedin-U isoform X4 [Salvelinus fontinalis]